MQYTKKTKKTTAVLYPNCVAFQVRTGTSSNALWHAEERLGARLAGNINDFVGVGEAVEAGSGALRVGAHVLEVQPVADIQCMVEADALGDVVDAVASGPEDGVLDAVCCLVRRDAAVDGTVASAEDLRDWVLVVEHDAREVAVDTVVEVDHVAVVVRLWVVDGAASNDVAGQGEGRRDVVAPWLSHHVDMARDVLVKSLSENSRHAFEVLAGESTSDVNGLHVKAELCCLIHDGASITDSLEEGQWIAGSGSNMKTDANNIQAQLLGEGEKLNGRIQRSSKLHAEAAQARGIVGDDTDKEFGIWEESLDLVKLISIIESHLLDSVICGIADV